MEQLKGYKAKNHGRDVMRYCRMLSMRDDAALIAEYRRMHSNGVIWQEILDGIRQVGILEMELYLRGNTAVMIMEVPLDFDWDTSMARLATLPRQQEWEDFMAKFQQTEEGVSAEAKWMPMERVFHLYESPDDK